MIDISNLNNKTHNKGADESGKLAASEWNTLVSAVGELQGTSSESISYEEQELTEEQQAQVRANIGAGTYSKPSGGIPASDLANGVIPDTSQLIDKDVDDLTNYTKTSDLSGMLSDKQDVIQDLSTIRSGAAAGATSVQPAEFNELKDEVDTIGNGAYEEAWDGSSAPVVAGIPAGVSVTYNGTSYTGTLAASASTVDKIYLVSDGNGNYDRYVTIENRGGTYSWKKVGTTAIPLSDYATKAEISQLEAEVDEVDGLRVSTSPVDLSFEDGYGNVLAEFGGGHIKTKNFDSRDVADLDTETTDEVDLEFTDSDGNAVVRFMDGHIKTKNFDSANIDTGGKNGYQRETYFDTTNDCVQQNASSFTATNPNSYVSQVIYNDHAVLILPDSYTKNGTPTRLIIFCKQGNSQITDSSNPIMASNAMGNIFHFLVSRGYAVLAADGVPDGLSSTLELDDTRVSGNYVAVQSTRKAYDYVIKNYNIYDDGAFIFGYSQGGIYAQNVIDLSGIPFLGCAMVSPTLSMRYHLWDLSTSKTIGSVNWTRTSRLNIARLFGFDAVTTNAELLALQFDKEKVAGYDPWNRNVENPYEGFTQTSQYGSNLWALPTGADIDAITMKKKIGCPTKIWMAENDGTLGVDVAKVFVKACRNAGQVCDLHLYNDGNHHIFQSTYQSPAISTFSDQGNSYNLYPITYEIASFFYRCGGLSLTD